MAQEEAAAASAATKWDTKSQAIELSHIHKLSRSLSCRCLPACPTSSLPACFPWLIPLLFVWLPYLEHFRPSFFLYVAHASRGTLEMSSTSLGGVDIADVSSSVTQQLDGSGVAAATATARKRVMIVTMGSRGDTQPYVALGIALHERAQYDVVLLTHQPHREFVEHEGRGLVEFHGMMGDPAEFLQSEEGARIIYDAGGSELLKVMVDEGRKMLEPNFRETLRFAREWQPDLLISSITEMSIVVATAEILQVPMVIASTVPTYPSEHHAPIMMRPRPFPFRWMNKAYVRETVRERCECTFSRQPI